MSESFARETLNQIKEKLGMSEEQQGPEQLAHDTERKLRDRIEQLERERDELKAYIDRYSYAELADEAEARCSAEAKLTKAVEALREIEADCDADYPPSHGAIKYAIRTTLAKLEGKDE